MGVTRLSRSAARRPRGLAGQAKKPAGRSGGQVDQAAVLGVVLAAAVSISAADGDWEPIESVVGVVLLLLLKGYVDTRQIVGKGRGARRCAVSGVVGLGGVLVAAWPLQSLLSCLNCCYLLDDVRFSGLLCVIWLVVFGGYARLRRRGTWPLRWLSKIARRLWWTTARRLRPTR